MQQCRSSPSPAAPVLHFARGRVRVQRALACPRSKPMPMYTLPRSPVCPSWVFVLRGRPQAHLHPRHFPLGALPQATLPTTDLGRAACGKQTAGFFFADGFPLVVFLRSGDVPTPALALLRSCAPALLHSCCLCCCLALTTVCCFASLTKAAARLQSCSAANTRGSCIR